MSKNYQIIDISQSTLWDKALEDIPHTYAHKWEYCNAISISSGLKTFLFVAKYGRERLLCPLSIREIEDGFPELVSPYGFGGIISTCPSEKYDSFKRIWIDFAQQHSIVTAYIMQHPMFRLSCYSWEDDLYEHHGCYWINLRENIDSLWNKMRKGCRYEVRRWDKYPGAKVITDKRILKEKMKDLYPQTMNRVGASAIYNFSSETLDKLSEAPGSLILGVEEYSRIVAVTLFLHTPFTADYFLNAATPEGRKYTRFLVWLSIKYLKERNISFLNLGGGAKPGDTLEQFKRRFGGQMIQGQVLRQVFDQNKYMYLCSKYCQNNHSKIDYFPPYWKTN